MPRELIELPNGGRMEFRSGYDEESMQVFAAVSNIVSSIPGIKVTEVGGDQKEGSDKPDGGMAARNTVGRPPLQRPGGATPPSANQGRVPAPFSQPSPGPQMGESPGGQPALTPTPQGLMAGGAQPMTRRRPSMTAPPRPTVGRPGLA